MLKGNIRTGKVEPTACAQCESPEGCLSGCIMIKCVLLKDTTTSVQSVSVKWVELGEGLNTARRHEGVKVGREELLLGCVLMQNFRTRY